MMVDSHNLFSFRISMKEAAKRSLLRLVSGVFAAGTAQAHYVQSLGVASNRIFMGYDAVDNDYFSRRADALRSIGLKVVGGLTLPDNYFLACCRFIPEKNLIRLLEAYHHYRSQWAKSQVTRSAGERAKPWDLVLIGDGPLKESLCQLRMQLSLVDSVHLPGFKQYYELPGYFAHANALLLPSTSETWGLVVNEAMAVGLPILLSNRCGCALDLIQESLNGFTFDPYDVLEMAQLMTRVANLDKEACTAMGKASRRIIADWGLERYTRGLSSAVKAAITSPVHERAWADRMILDLLIKWRSFSLVRTS
jgi:glycosyltransferase involved in cell wall biosynthesis